MPSTLDYHSNVIYKTHLRTLVIGGKVRLPKLKLVLRIPPLSCERLLQSMPPPTSAQAPRVNGTDQQPRNLLRKNRTDGNGATDPMTRGTRTVAEHAHKHQKCLAGSSRGRRTSAATTGEWTARRAPPRRWAGQKLRNDNACSPGALKTPAARSDGDSSAIDTRAARSSSPWP